MLPAIRRARDFAERFHNGQRYGELPYTAHLADVSQVLADFGPPPIALNHAARRRLVHLHVAAWLHDVVEDTDACLEDVHRTFGAHVASLVHAVTDAAGATRDERKARTYPKIRRQGPEAVALKLADRIANVRSSGRHVPRLFHRYREEQPAFERALRQAGEWNAMWDHLNTLLVAPRRAAWVG